MKSFVFVLLLFKTFFSIPATECFDEFDITKDLNDTIVGIFQRIEPQNMIKLIESLANSGLADFRTTPYAYYYTWLNGDKTRVEFYHLRLSQASANESCISYGFLDNKIQLHSSELVMNLSGIWNVKHLLLDYEFNSEIHLKECTISAIRQPNNSVNLFLIDLQYSQMNIRTNGPATQFSGFRKPFEYILPSILREHMNRNQNLSHVLSEIYDNQLANHIISKHPNFLDHENQFHYRIPTAPIGYLNLRNIVVKGLSNFHSLNFTIKPNTIIYTLLVKDIRGSTILEDASKPMTSSLELHYIVDSMTISVTPKINRISIRAENYSIIETNSKTSLTDVQSDIIMDRIENAIGLSIMPSMEFQRTNRSSLQLNQIEKKNSLRRLLIEKSSQSDKNDIEHPHTTKISINDQHLSTKSPQIVTNNHFTYHITFSNLTILNFISGDKLDPEQIQCPLFNNSQFSYQMSIDPSRESFQNDKANSTDVKFNFNLSSPNISIIKVNDTMPNDSCEFQISNDQDIKIHSSPPVKRSTTGSPDEQFEIKKKIDKTLTSMANESFVQTIKSTVSLPFNACVQSAKVMDEFFRSFIDKLLKKCSFRKNVP